MPPRATGTTTPPTSTINLVTDARTNSYMQDVLELAENTKASEHHTSFESGELSNDNPNSDEIYLKDATITVTNSDTGESQTLSAAESEIASKLLIRLDARADLKFLSPGQKLIFMEESNFDLGEDIDINNLSEEDQSLLMGDPEKLRPVDFRRLFDTYKITYSGTVDKVFDDSSETNWIPSSTVRILPGIVTIDDDNNNTFSEAPHFTPVSKKLFKKDALDAKGFITVQKSIENIIASYKEGFNSEQANSVIRDKILSDPRVLGRVLDVHLFAAAKDDENRVIWQVVVTPRTTQTDALISAPGLKPNLTDAVENRAEGVLRSFGRIDEVDEMRVSDKALRRFKNDRNVHLDGIERTYLGASDGGQGIKANYKFMATTINENTPQIVISYNDDGSPKDVYEASQGDFNKFKKAVLKKYGEFGYNLNPEWFEDGFKAKSLPVVLLRLPNPGNMDKNTDLIGEGFANNGQFANVTGMGTFTEFSFYRVNIKPAPTTINFIGNDGNNAAIPFDLLGLTNEELNRFFTNEEDKITPESLEKGLKKLKEAATSRGFMPAGEPTAEIIEAKNPREETTLSITFKLLTLKDIQYGLVETQDENTTVNYKDEDTKAMFETEFKPVIDKIKGDYRGFINERLIYEKIAELRAIGVNAQITPDFQIEENTSKATISIIVTEQRIFDFKGFSFGFNYGGNLLMLNAGISGSFQIDPRRSLFAGLSLAATNFLGDPNSLKDDRWNLLLKPNMRFDFAGTRYTSTTSAYANIPLVQAEGEDIPLVVGLEETIGFRLPKSPIDPIIGLGVRYNGSENNALQNNGFWVEPSVGLTANARVGQTNLASTATLAAAINTTGNRGDAFSDAYLRPHLTGSLNTTLPISIPGTDGTTFGARMVYEGRFSLDGNPIGLGEEITNGSRLTSFYTPGQYMGTQTFGLEVEPFTTTPLWGTLRIGPMAELGVTDGRFHAGAGVLLGLPTILPGTQLGAGVYQVLNPENPNDSKPQFGVKLDQSF